VVDDGGDAAVRVEGRVPRLLLRVLHYVDGLPCVLCPIGCLEFFKEDRDLYAVWGGCGGLMVVQSIGEGDEPNVRSSMPELAMRPVGSSAIVSGVVE
jgi:hypothetical protein